MIQAPSCPQLLSAPSCLQWLFHCVFAAPLKADRDEFNRRALQSLRKYAWCLPLIFHRVYFTQIVLRRLQPPTLRGNCFSWPFAMSGWCQTGNKVMKTSHRFFFVFRAHALDPGDPQISFYLSLQLALVRQVSTLTHRPHWLDAESCQDIRFLFFISSKKIHLHYSLFLFCMTVDFCSFCLHVWRSRSYYCVISSLSHHIPIYWPLVFAVGVRSDGAVAVGSEYSWGWSALSTPADSTAQCPETLPACPWYA